MLRSEGFLWMGGDSDGGTFGKKNGNMINLACSIASNLKMEIAYFESRKCLSR